MNEQMIVVFFADGHVDRRTVYSKDAITDEYIGAVVAKCIQSWEKTQDIAAWLPVVGWQRVAAGYFPTEPMFRDAWRHSAGAVAVDMPVARQLCLRKLRVADHPAVTAAATPEALKAAVLGILKTT